MSLPAVVTMVLICGFVWGGFAALLVSAVRKEKEKLGAGRIGDEA